MSQSSPRPDHQPQSCTGRRGNTGPIIPERGIQVQIRIYRSTIQSGITCVSGLIFPFDVDRLDFCRLRGRLLRPASFRTTLSRNQDVGHRRFGTQPLGSSFGPRRFRHVWFRRFHGFEKGMGSIQTTRLGSAPLRTGRRGAGAPAERFARGTSFPPDGSLRMNQGILAPSCNAQQTSVSADNHHLGQGLFT